MIAEWRARSEAFLAMADDYAEAARVVAAASQDTAACWHLLAHALELALKAELLWRGIDEGWLMRTVGHSLRSARRARRDRTATFELADGVERLIEILDAAHAMQSLRYPSLLSYSFDIAPAAAHRTLAAHLGQLRDRMGIGSTERDPTSPAVI